MIRKIIIISRSLPAVLAVLVFIQAEAQETHCSYAGTTQKATETPHFWQLDPRGEFKNGGKNYCCPVAVSDSLVYLADHDFPELVSKGEGVQPQIDLINLLASSEYLGTDPNTGTRPGPVLSGMEKYIMAKGYQCSTLEYEGWRDVGRNRQKFVKGGRPDLDWLKKGVLDPHGAVWLTIGWYTCTGDSHWKRTGGHWVTLVGFDAADPCALLVHNPSKRVNGGKPGDFSRDIVHFQPVTSGTLDTGKGPTVDAAGLYQISGPGLPKRKNVVAFLDSAIVLVVAK